MIKNKEKYKTLKEELIGLHLLHCKNNICNKCLYRSTGNIEDKDERLTSTCFSRWLKHEYDLDIGDI